MSVDAPLKPRFGLSLLARWRPRDAGQVLPFSLILLAMVICAAVPELLAPHNPIQTDLSVRLLPPGSAAAGSRYLLGTDDLGRDVLSRVIWGARVSLSVSLAAVLLAGFVGSGLGVVAGFYQGALGAVIMRLADLVLSVPFFLLAILTVVVLGPSLLNLVIVLALVRWPRYARVAFGQTLDAKNRDFVKAARSLGAPASEMIAAHVVPEVLPPLIVVATLELGLMVLYEAALSFIGLGVQPPTASWGSMLSEGQQYVATAWWLATFPGLALFLVVLSVNLLGDYIRDLLDPQERSLRS
ncbi:MAG: ABC transporter permease [Chloroflexota bacterium]